jgi:hypothetical protein
MNENLAERAGIDVGETVEVTFWAPDELGSIVPDGGRFHGPKAELRVVGIIRGPRDLAAGANSANLLVDESVVYGGPGVWAATPGAQGFGGILVNARGGDVGTATQAIESAFGDRPFNLAPNYTPGTLEPTGEAIRYEARGVSLFAAVAALATAVFIGQAAARQARREWGDLDTLMALGWSRRETLLAGGVRALPTAAAAAAVAAGLAVVVSPVGPVGVARSAEFDPGLHVDGWVIGIGAVLVLALTFACSWLPLYRLHRRVDMTGGRRPARSFVVPAGPLPLPAATGVRLAVNGGRSGGIPLGTALASFALAAGAVAATFGLVASLDVLTDTPERFGVTWDYSFGAPVEGEQEEAATAFFEDRSDVAAAAGIVGADLEINGRVYWAHSFAPVPGIDGTIDPAITDGREPVRSDEIALGEISMRELGVGIGDTVDVTTTVTGSEPATMTVVGTALVNDTFEGSPGRGAIVVHEWIAAAAPEAASPDPFVVRLASGADHQAFRDDLERAFPGTVSGPVKQAAIRNVERVRYVPYLVAALVGLLAVASLTHALVLSTRRQRGQLAVLQALGFRRGQTAAAVGWQATALGVGAVVIGLPLGVVAGRWTWRLIANQLGVASGPVVPLVPVAGAIVIALVLANLAAAVPAWRASRVAPAEALRVE